MNNLHPVSHFNHSKAQNYDRKHERNTRFKTQLHLPHFIKNLIKTVQRKKTFIPSTSLIITQSGNHQIQSRKSVVEQDHHPVSQRKATRKCKVSDRYY